MSTNFADIQYSSAWDKLFRAPGFMTTYGSKLTPWILDYKFSEITIFYGTVGFILLIMLPAWPFTIRTIRLYLGLFLAMGISWSLLAGGIYGVDWASSKIHTVTDYTSFRPNSSIVADVGLWINLHGFNVTVEGTPRNQLGETISYNEGFKWTWQQGIFGFSEYAGHVQQDFRKAQHRGSPTPALRIAEYFTLDGEYIRWGRNYRLAGYYCFLGLRTAWVFWHLVVIIFLIGSPAVASAMCAFAGILITASVATFATLISYANKAPLRIPFPGGIIAPALGWCWYLCAVIGGLLMFVGYFVAPNRVIDRWTGVWSDSVLDLTDQEKEDFKTFREKNLHTDLSKQDGSFGRKLGLRERIGTQIRKTLRRTGRRPETADSSATATMSQLREEGAEPLLAERQPMMSEVGLHDEKIEVAPPDWRDM